MARCLQCPPSGSCLAPVAPDEYQLDKQITMPTPRALRPEVVTLFASGFLLLGFNINMW
ncbi:hypothetical protein GIV73_13895, partial [Pseudomonas syringae]|nr:hypothetical protein [Pseudomonas syringae]